MTLPTVPGRVAPSAAAHDGAPVSGARYPRALVILVCTASAVIIGAGIHAAAWLVAPTFLALVVVITIHPLRGRLLGLGLPGWAATTVIVALVLGLVLALAGVLVVAVAQLATVLPLYAGEANALVTSTTATLGRFGVGADQLRALTAALNFSKVLGLATGLLLGLSTLLGNVVFLLTLLLFLCVEASTAGDRLAIIVGGRRPVDEALRGFAVGTRRYFGVTTVIGLVTGAVDTVLLALLGIPGAALWGLLVFLTNYIPYLGFFIGLGPPALLALLVGGWPLLAVVAALFLVINFVLTSLVQPYYVGDAVGLSVSVTLVALVLWGWLLGPVGAVLAIPLTLLLKVVLVDGDPRAVWADALLGSARRVHLLRTRTVPPDPGDAPGRPPPAPPAGEES